MPHHLPSDDERAWFREFIDRYQTALGEQRPTKERIVVIERIGLASPSSLSHMERVLVGILLKHLKSQSDETDDSAIPSTDEPDSRAMVSAVTLSPIDTALTFVALRHSDPHFSLGQVADHVHLSRWHLAHLLREQGYPTLRAHLRAVRLSHAKSLLRRTRLSVKEIADQVGYSKTAELDRNFKARFGMTPKEFRTATNRNE